MDVRTLYSQAAVEATRLIDGVDGAVVGQPTLCTEWTVGDLINHMVGNSQEFAVARELRSVTSELPSEVPDGDRFDGNPAAAWRAAAQRCSTAYQEDSALEETVELPPLGQLSGQVVLTIAVFDLVTHCADLAHATDQAMPDPALCESALAFGREVLAEGRDPDAFEPEQPAPDGASMPIRLLAFAGRKI